MATEFKVRLENRPGTLAQVGTVLGDADVNIVGACDERNINIDSVYVTTAGHVVLAVADLDGAIQVAEGMTVTSPE